MKRSVAVEPFDGVYPEHSRRAQGRLRKAINILNNNLHSAHCRACKERIGELLKSIYGDCRISYQFPWSSYPEDYTTTPIGDLLQKIRTDLGNLRGHRDFIKSPLVPPCDFYVIDPPFILEFDESQHFSQPRLLCLSLYPKEISMGFSVPRWQELCREINAADDTPIDRDERRAWYDTLRDLVPSIHGFAPTVRLYADEFPWCSFTPSSSHSPETCRDLLTGRLPVGNLNKNS